MRANTPTATDSSERQWSTIPFANFVLHDARFERGRKSSDALGVDGSAFGLELDEHLFPYEGCSLSRADFVWGIHGTRTVDQMSYDAHAEASKRGVQSFRLQATYRVNRLDGNRYSTERDQVRNSGFLHTTRVQAEFRRDIESRLLPVVAKKYPGIELAANAEKPLARLLYDHPMLLAELFELEPSVDMIVHPVRPSWHSKLSGVNVCTMRRIPGRIAAEMQHMPDVPVNV